MKDALVFKLVAITAVSFFGGFGMLAEGYSFLGYYLLSVAMVCVLSAVANTIIEILEA